MWQNIQRYYSPWLDVITFSIMIGMFIYVIIHYGKLPDEIPIHFNLAGEADGWGSKGTIIGLMVLNVHAVGICFVINYFLIIRSDNTKDSLQMVNLPFIKKDELTEEQIILVKKNTARMLAFVNLIASIMFATIYHGIIQNGLGVGNGLDENFGLLVVLLFVPIIYYGWKMYSDVKNSGPVRS